MENLKSLATAILLFSIIGCDGGTLWKDGEYEVIWIDSNGPYMAECDAKIDMCKELTGETILAVGSNERFIVTEVIGKESDKSTYYIIDKNISGFNTNMNLPNSVAGPYSKEQFNTKVKLLNLPGFSKTF